MNKIKHSFVPYLLAGLFLFSSTNILAEDKTKQAQIDVSMAESRIEQLEKRLKREYAIDGVDSVDARKTQGEIANERRKLFKAKKELAESQQEKES